MVIAKVGLCYFSELYLLSVRWTIKLTYLWFSVAFIMYTREFPMNLLYHFDHESMFNRRLRHCSCRCWRSTPGSTCPLEVTDTPLRRID